LTELSVFFVVALAPTLLALWFLRRNPTLWQAIAVGSLAFAVVGLLSVVMFFAVHDSPRDLAPTLLGLFGLAQLLGVRLWTAAFVLFAFLAPTPRARQLLVAAVGFELVIGVCAAIHWSGALRGFRG